MAVSKKTSEEISKARREAGEQGGRAVKATFGSEITRRRFAELIGVTPNTIKRWEVARVVHPRKEKILNSPTNVFTTNDVEFGRLLIAVLRKQSGQVTLEEAAQIVSEQNRR